IAEAVDVEVRAFRTRSSDVQAGAEPAFRHRNYAGNQQRQILYVARFERQIANLLLRDDVAHDGAVFRVEWGRVGRYRDGIAELAQLQTDFRAERLSDFQHDSGQLVGTKSMHLTCKFVVTRQQIGDGVITGFAGHDFASDVRIDVPRRDGSPGDNRSAGIGNDPGDAGIIRLTEQASAASQTDGDKRGPFHAVPCDGRNARIRVCMSAYRNPA